MAGITGFMNSSCHASGLAPCPRQRGSSHMLRLILPFRAKVPENLSWLPMVFQVPASSPAAAVRLSRSHQDLPTGGAAGAAPRRPGGGSGVADAQSRAGPAPVGLIFQESNSCKNLLCAVVRSLWSLLLCQRPGASIQLVLKFQCSFLIVSSPEMYFSPIWELPMIRLCRLQKE